MGTNIDDLIKDISSNKLSSDEDSMVESIIGDLNNMNNGSRRQQQQQQQQQQHQQQQQYSGPSVPPQMTPEEKQMLLKQQQHQQQMMYEQQMQQQKIKEMQQLQHQQHIQHQQQNQQQKHKKEMDEKMEELEKMKQKLEDSKPKNFIEAMNIKTIIQTFKTTFIVFLLVVFFNLNSIDEFMRFKQFSIFYNIDTEKSTLLFTLFKAIFVSSLFYMINFLLK